MNAVPTPELSLLGNLFLAGDPAPRGALASAYRALGNLLGTDCPAVRLVRLGDTADSAGAACHGSADAESTRVLTLGAPGRLIELELVTTAPGMFRAGGVVLSRTGQPVVGGVLSVRHRAGHSHDVLDECGAFLVRGIPAGPVSVLFRSRWGTGAVTDWFAC